MGWQVISLLAAVAVPLGAMLGSIPAIAADPPRISGPAVHENLAIYLVHGPSTPGPVPLTLGEALAAGKVVVHETGSVNRLTIENTGKEEIFVQAGDIVKGGQQDRVLTVSFLVPPGSGRLDIGAYCVEQGRWSARGKEDVKRFASADKALPSRAAKLALHAPIKPRVAEPATSPSPIEQQHSRTRIEAGNAVQRQEAQRAYSGGSRQSDVWSSVAAAQRKLSGNLGETVAAAASASSLQLSLENEKLVAARRAYETALAAAGTAADDVIGYVVAVGGRLVSGDVYASNALFRKMWTKQLEAAATEAIAEKTTTASSAPTVDDVRAFIARADAGKADAAPLPGSSTLVRETRDSDGAVLAETRRSAGGLVHRAYVARH